MAATSVRLFHDQFLDNAGHLNISPSEVWELFSPEDLSELFETGSVSFRMGSRRYVVSLVIDLEV